MIAGAGFILLYISGLDLELGHAALDGTGFSWV